MNNGKPENSAPTTVATPYIGFFSATMSVVRLAGAKTDGPPFACKGFLGKRNAFCGRHLEREYG